MADNPVFDMSVVIIEIAGAGWQPIQLNSSYSWSRIPNKYCLLFKHGVDMIYIKIPDNMTFKKIILDKVEQDAFVPNEGDEPPILLQPILKKALQHRPRGINEDIRKEEPGKDNSRTITVYHRRPPFTDAMYLRYVVNKNATKPTESVVEVMGSQVKSLSPSRAGSSTPWFYDAPLSKERREAIEKKYDETRLNRRKTGDSPNTN